MIKKILFVSYGSISKQHIKNVGLINKDIIIGVLRTKNREPIKKNYFMFTNVAKAIKFAPDAIFICSPANTHIYYLKKFKNICKNIFIEKPLCSNKNQIKHLQIKKKINLQLGYFLRYHPYLQKVKKIIKKNTYGKIRLVKIEAGQYLPFWRKNTPYEKTVSSIKKLGGGVMLELSHEIDYAIWLFGVPKLLFCKNKKLSNLKINVEDYSSILLDYPKEKKIVQINLNMFQKNLSRSCTIYFENKTLRIDFISGQLMELNNDKIKIIHKLKKNYSKRLIYNQDNHFLSRAKLLKKNKNKYGINDFANIKTGKILSKILSRLIKSNNTNKIVNCR